MSHYAALPKAVALALPITLGAWTVQAADLIETAEQDGRFNGSCTCLRWWAWSARRAVFCGPSRVSSPARAALRLRATIGRRLARHPGDCQIAASRRFVQAVFPR
jgi:hypothetical protein